MMVGRNSVTLASASSPSAADATVNPQVRASSVSPTPRGFVVFDDQHPLERNRRFRRIGHRESVPSRDARRCSDPVPDVSDASLEALPAPADPPALSRMTRGRAIAEVMLCSSYPTQLVGGRRPDRPRASRARTPTAA